MGNSGLLRRDEILQYEESDRLAARADIKEKMQRQFRSYRSATTPLQKRNALYLALNNVNNAVQNRVATKGGSKENQNVTLMQMGAAVNEIFGAKTLHQFEKRFEAIWRPDWK